MLTLWRRRTLNELKIVDLKQSGKFKEEQAQKQKAKDDGKYNRFVDKRGQAFDNSEAFASRSPDFNKKKYPYMSEKEFRKKKP